MGRWWCPTGLGWALFSFLDGRRRINRESFLLVNDRTDNWEVRVSFIREKSMRVIIWTVLLSPQRQVWNLPSWPSFPTWSRLALLVKVGRHVVVGDGCWFLIRNMKPYCKAFLWAVFPFKYGNIGNFNEVASGKGKHVNRCWFFIKLIELTCPPLLGPWWALRVAGSCRMF